MKCISGVLSTIVLLASLFATAYCHESQPVAQVQQNVVVPSAISGEQFKLIISLSGDTNQAGFGEAMEIMEKANYKIGSNEKLLLLLKDNAYCPLKSKDNSGAINPVAYQCFSFEECKNLDAMVNQTVRHVLDQVKLVKELKNVELDVIVSFNMKKELLKDKKAFEILCSWKKHSTDECNEAIANSGFWGYFTLKNIALTVGIIAAGGALGVLVAKKPEIVTIPASKIQSYGGATASWISTKCAGLFSRTPKV